jgi:ABC-type dipeptide/oligopeptide/nickel transport system permease subunit
MTAVEASSQAQIETAVAHSRKRRLRRIPASLSLRVGIAILGLYVLVAIVSAFWTPYDPTLPGAGEIFLPPSPDYPLGTDRLGQDILSRIMAGTRVDLGITAASVALAFVIGTFLGTIAGYYRGAVDAVILRITEVFQAFPALLLAMLIVQAIGPGVRNIVCVMAFVGFPDYLRLARAEVMTRRTWPYAEAARMAGARSWRVAFRHLLPNSTGPLFAFVSINAAWVALNTASLGFLGLGLEAGTPEWGSMIARGREAIMTGDWWVSFFPGVAIVGLAGAFYLLGDAISDATDPRRR